MDEIRADIIEKHELLDHITRLTAERDEARSEVERLRELEGAIQELRDAAFDTAHTELDDQFGGAMRRLAEGD